MDREALELLFYAWMCLAASYLFMRNYRAYINALTNRLPGESWKAAWKRGAAEHDLNVQAQLQMFGSRWATAVGRLVVMGILVALSWFIVIAPFLAVLLLAHMGWGVYVTHHLGVTATPIYARLLKRDRATYRLLHAVLWPLHARRARARSDHQ